MAHDDPLSALVVERDEDRRWENLRTFVIGEPSLARVVGERGVASDDPGTREVAADMLGSVASIDPSAAAAIVDVLIPRLEIEEDAGVLDSLITALGHAGDPRARAGVRNHANHPDETVRFAVAWSLPALDLDADSLDVLRRLSADRDDRVRDWATFGLAESDAKDPPTIEALAARTDDPHDDTRAESIFGLARRRDPRARALIERELGRPVHGSLIERALEELEA